jgi:hypothetical protein
MVAMTGGLFLAMAVMALSRDFSRFTQQSMRVTNATLASINGFDRLSSDLARAGHMTTPNINADPRVCNRPDPTSTSIPAGVARLRAVVIGNSAVANTEVSRAGLTPMSITIAGAIDAMEQLDVTSILNTNGRITIGVDLNTPAAARLGLVNDSSKVIQNAALLRSIFIGGGTGRIVRLWQANDGLEQYGVVASVDETPKLQLVLAAATPFQFRTGSNTTRCGINGNCTGCGINVVNLVRYRLMALKGNADYDQLFTASEAADLPYEAGRVELVREELGSDAATPIPGTQELIAEYATDLQFTVAQATGATDPTLINPASSTIDASYNSTQLLRGLRTRLSVRSREADRLADVAGAATGQYRIQLPAAGGTSGSSEPVPYARVRSLQADIPLRNLENANW